MPNSRNFFDYFISNLLIMFNSPPPPATTPSISSPNTTTTSLPSRPNNLISTIQSDPSPDLEQGNQPSPVPSSDNTDIDLPEWKRISKVAQTVGYGGLGVSITLFVNKPGSATTHPALYMAYLTLVCLGLATSVLFSVYLIIKKESPVVSLVQKELIYFTSFFVVLACFFRFQIELPHIYFGFVMVPTLICMLVISLYVVLRSRCQRPTHETDGILFPGRSFYPEQG